MQTTTMIEVRCPFGVQSKRGHNYTCNRLCVKVAPGASGEAYCTACKKTFEFEIRPDMSVDPRVRAQK